MSRTQKRIVIALACANALLVLAFAAVITRRPVSTSLSPSAPPQATGIGTAGLRPTRVLKTRASTPVVPTPDACEWRATHMLARAELGGTVMLAPDEALRIEITYPLPPDQGLDEAAQLVWAALDVARMLAESNECADFPRTDVSILAQGEGGKTRIDASVDTADLLAFSGEALSEEAFIDRVAYTTVQLR